MIIENGARSYFKKNIIMCSLCCFLLAILAAFFIVLLVVYYNEEDSSYIGLVIFEAFFVCGFVICAIFLINYITQYSKVNSYAKRIAITVRVYKIKKKVNYEASRYSGSWHELNGIKLYTNYGKIYYYIDVNHQSNKGWNTKYLDKYIKDEEFDAEVEIYENTRIIAVIKSAKLCALVKKMKRAFFKK